MRKPRKPAAGRGRFRRARPGGSPAARARPSAMAKRRPTEPVGTAAQGSTNSRFTGRALVLALVLLVLAVSYGSSFRAYLHQRDEITTLQSTIAERKSEIETLEREKSRWEDPAYVRAKARERFGYVMPGDTSYVVLGADGKPLEPQSELDDASSVGKNSEPTGWWDPLWASVQLAGKPQPAKAPKPPADEIDGASQE